MNSWEEIRLGEVFQIKHGWAFKGEYFSSEGDLIVVTPGNFFEQGGFRVRDGKEKFYLGKFPDEYLLKKNDVVIAMTEQGPGLLGSPGLVPSDNKFLHNQRIGLISDIKTDKIFNKFIYYLFFTNGVRNEIFGSATGTKVKHTAPKRIYQIKILLPLLSTQRKIASILSAYDDLIENNLKRIKLLEERVQRTYEEWFVKFRVNSEQLEVSKETGLPKGWILKDLNFVSEIISGYSFKSSDYINDGSYKIVTIKNVQDGFFVPEVTDTLLEIPAKVKEEQKLKTGDIILSLTGNVGRSCLVYGSNYLLNQRVAKISPNKNSNKGFIYTFLRNKVTITNLENLSNGVAQQNLSPINMGLMKLVLPTQHIMDEFGKVTNQIVELICNLNLINGLLKESRDILLPRIMSGVINLEQVKEETLAIAAEPRLHFSIKN
jgi:type I restriction enzyme S subunit